MINQLGGITPLTDLSPFISFLIFCLMIVLTLYCYKNLKIFEVMVVIYGISLTMAIISIGQNILMFSPWFQIFFILFESFIFYRVWKFRG